MSDAGVRRPYADEPARRPLIALAILASIATVTGTFMYTYPETMAPIQDEMVLVHDVSGDLMILATVGIDIERFGVALDHFVVDDDLFGALQAGLSKNSAFISRPKVRYWLLADIQPPSDIRPLYPQKRT